MLDKKAKISGQCGIHRCILINLPPVKISVEPYVCTFRYQSHQTNYFI